jgi:hypothetical protein
MVVCNINHVVLPLTYARCIWFTVYEYYRCWSHVVAISIGLCYVHKRNVDYVDMS